MKEKHFCTRKTITCINPTAPTQSSHTLFHAAITGKKSKCLGGCTVSVRVSQLQLLWLSNQSTEHPHHPSYCLQKVTKVPRCQAPPLKEDPDSGFSSLSTPSDAFELGTMTFKAGSARNFPHRNSYTRGAATPAGWRAETGWSNGMEMPSSSSAQNPGPVLGSRAEVGMRGGSSGATASSIAFLQTLAW